MRAAALIALLPCAALAEPVEGVMTNAKGAVLQLYGITDEGFDFTLSNVWPCEEGDVTCLVVAGHAAATAKGYTWADPADATSRIFFADSPQGVKVLQTSGDLGSGTGNRAAKLAFPGDYAPDAAAAARAGDPGDGDAPAEGGDDAAYVGFRTPSGNIGCLFEVAEVSSVRCDLADYVASFKVRPESCEFDWGGAFGISSDGQKGEALCVSDTVLDPGAEVLDYGSSLEQGGIACRSDKTGVTCETASGHGFQISRRAQRVY